MKINHIYGFLLAFSAAASLSADTITVTGGDKLSGKILEIHGDTLTFETSYAGKLTIKRADVTSIETDSELFARKKGGVEEDKIQVSISHDETGNPILISSDEKQKLRLGEAQTVWLLNANDPDFPPVKRWAFSAALGFGGKSGNTKSFTANAAFDAVLTEKKYTMRFYANMARERTNNENVTDQYTGGIDYEYRPKKYHSWYLREELTRNTILNISYRNILATGYGWYIWNKNNPDTVNSVLRLRAGLAHTYTSRDDTSETGNDISADFGLLFRYVFDPKGTFKGLTWQTEITYQPVIDNWGDCHITHETKLEYFLENLKISTEFGLMHDYYGEVAEGTENLDTIWFLRFKKSW